MDGDEYTVEMRWKCSSCGHVNLGRHMVCTNCGNPKDDSEAYVMPDDPSLAQAVTDPELLKLAEAAPNWTCPYCGSSERATNDRCSHCGAKRTFGASSAVAQPRAPQPQVSSSSAGPRIPTSGSSIANRVWDWGFRWVFPVLWGGMFLLVGAVLIHSFFKDRSSDGPSLLTPDPKPVSKEEMKANVVRMYWKTTATVLRRQLEKAEGFKEKIPKDAVDVKADGKKIHHYNKVATGYHFDTVTEHVPKTGTETYTAWEKCGETCTTSSGSCHRVCSSKGNGFASCRMVCSPGSRTCRPKMCMVTRTRTVSGVETKVTSKKVSDYRSDPVYATWYHWKQWVWKPNRHATHDGQGDERLAWPDKASLHVGEGCAKGEKERVVYSERYFVDLKTRDGKTYTWHPKTLDLYKEFSVGQVWVLRVYDKKRFRPVRRVFKK